MVWKALFFYFAKLCCILTAQLVRCLICPLSPTKESIQWNFFPIWTTPWHSHFSGNWGPLPPIEKLVGYNPLLESKTSLLKTTGLTLLTNLNSTLMRSFDNLLELSYSAFHGSLKSFLSTQFILPTSVWWWHISGNQPQLLISKMDL